MSKPISLCPRPECAEPCAELCEARAFALAVLELEKAREKLKAKALALRLSRAEQLLKKSREARHG